MDGMKNKTGVFFIFFFLFVIISFIGMSQDPPPKDGKPTKIYVEHADSSELDMVNNPENYILRRNVVFRHDSAFMYCQLAYLNNVNNSLEAFDSVRIEQGDTLSMYGDYLHYDANLYLAKMRNNVRMENMQGEDNYVTLYTDSFNYNRLENLAYFFEGGMLIDSLNELTSVYGQYSPDTKMAFFKEKVRLVNPQFVLTSDTLEYDTKTRIAVFSGISVIESDSGVIYSTKGRYNTITGESEFYDRSVVVSKDKTQNITADTLHYEKEAGYVEAFGNMVLNDTVKKMILMGDYGFYNEITGYAFACDSAQMIDCSQKDTLFLHADTLKIERVEDEREVKAYHGARFYRIDVQGICDSLQFNTIDSLIRMYQTPVIWNTDYQITGDTIKILFNDSTIEKMDVLNSAFSIEKIDSTYYNQMKGRNMFSFFNAGELYKIKVEGNAESIYYPLDEDGAFAGCNKTEVCSFIEIDVVDKKPERILFYPDPKGKIVPIPDLTPENKFLRNFVDYNYLRPRSREEIFSKVEIKAEDIQTPRKVRAPRKK
jgi:lipopolysaccharide export system protein LptA